MPCPFFLFKENIIAIEHKNIVDAERHEPKGISTAAINSSYKANGAGSGSWRKTKIADLEGVTGDSGVLNKAVVSDGSGNFKLLTQSSHGSMIITNNTTNFPVTAAVDSTLQNNSDYILFSGTGAPWSSENLFGISFDTDSLIVPVTGIYRITSYMNVEGFPSNTAKVAMKFRINGTGSFSARRPIVKSNSSGDYGLLMGFALVPLTAGDFIQLYVASTVTGNLLIGQSNTILSLERQTT